jgi:hypothetical protein
VAVLAASVALALVLGLGALAAHALRSDPRAAAAPEGRAVDLPAVGAGVTTVLTSADVVTHPRGTVVREQLQRYFDAINGRDYAAWSQTVTPDRATAQPQPDWVHAYRSTSEGTIRVDRIDDQPDGSMLVRVQFVSMQDVADAPRETPAARICWRTTLPMAGSPPRIATTGAGSSTHAAC